MLAVCCLLDACGFSFSFLPCPPGVFFPGWGVPHMGQWLVSPGFRNVLSVFCLCCCVPPFFGFCVERRESVRSLS